MNTSVNLGTIFLALNKQTDMLRESKYRVFKLSVSIPFYRSCMDSKVYHIDSNFQLLYPILIHTIGTVLFGFWNIFGAIESLKAIHTNLTGGEDYTEVIVAENYDSFTNSVWSNLNRSTSARIDRAGIDLLLNSQEEFMKQETDLFSDYNIRFLKDGLARKGYRGILDDDIRDFFETIQFFLSRES